MKELDKPDETNASKDIFDDDNDDDDVDDGDGNDSGGDDTEFGGRIRLGSSPAAGTSHIHQVISLSFTYPFVGTTDNLSLL